MVNRLIGVVGVIVVIALLILTAIPYIASTQIVRDRIAQELSLWSGYRVALGAATSINVWPLITAQLTDVTFSEPGADGEPVARVEKIEAGLSAFAALRGNIVFTDLRLIRPSLTVTAETMPPDTARAARGRFATAVASAQRLVRQNPTEPDLSKMPDDTFGTVEIVEGKLNISRDDAATEILTGVTGKVQWPAFNRNAAVSLSGIWRGELVSLDMNTPQPLLLLAGAAAPMTIAVKSSPLNLNFEGTANLSRDGYVQGKGNLSSPSLRRMLEWSGNEIAPGAAIGAISVDASVTGSVRRLNLSNATVTLDGNPSRGTLEVALTEPVPQVAGTLAFENINLQSFLSAFSALTPDRWGRYSTIDGHVAEQMSLDLRLSANTATAGSIAFTNVAATAQIKGGLAAFDISDATAFGGTVQAGFRIDQPGPESRMDVRLRGTGIDLGAMAKTMQVSYLMPIARGDLALSLKGDGNDWLSAIRTAQGTFSANLGPGAMAGINLATFAERARKGDFFSLNEIESGTVAFNSLTIKAKVENGTARLEKAEIHTAKQIITLNGLVPLPGRGLALSGSIGVEKGAKTAATEPMRFFIGGSWDSPYVSPVFGPSE